MPQAGTPEMNARMASIMDRGLEEEIADHYERARALYVEATKLDPADPVPARFLGELYRHHTGEWDLAADIGTALERSGR